MADADRLIETIEAIAGLHETRARAKVARINRALNEYFATRDCGDRIDASHVCTKNKGHAGDHQDIEDSRVTWTRDIEGLGGVPVLTQEDVRHMKERTTR